MASFLLSLLLLGESIQAPSVEVNLTNHPSQDRYASYSPDGSQILFESDRNSNWDLYVMNKDGSGVRAITTDPSNERRPCWHPDGTQVLFESDRSGKFQLYRADISGGSVKILKIPKMPGIPIFAQYSPNGSSIAYALKYEGDSSKLVVVDTLGGLKAELADYGFRSFYPRWSSDGQSLLFFSRHETNNQDDELYVIQVDGTDKKRLTDWPTHNFCPSWSPDGTMIAYAQSMKDSRPEIFVMNVAGSNAERLTYNEDGDTLPNWSPDGTKLLVTAYRGGNYEIVELTIPKR